MSSDGYFDDDPLDLDADALEQLDAIETAALRPLPFTAHRHLSPDNEDSFGDLTLDLDLAEAQRLDSFIEDTYKGKAQPVAGPSTTRTRATLQTTLFGDVLPPTQTSHAPRPQFKRTKSTTNAPFGRPAPKTKKWDHTAFAKTGLRRPASKSKGKQRQEDINDEDGEEFEQFPAPFVPIGPPPPMKLKPDLLEARHWVYPLNRPKRDYQFNIVKNSLFENSLVALPTGLGKTFVAGVIMLNYYRWFPEGKVVFIAPTKPLVAQQVEASHQACGIPGTDAIELTGENARKLRAKAWEDKRVFYMTAQTFIHDLQGGLCDPLDIILLVIDEAHRGMGNHSYAQVVRYLMAKNPHFRILALTATPGGTPDKVQDLVDSLHISHIEIRDENSLDLRPFIHEKRIEQHIIKMNDDINRVMSLLAKLMESLVRPLRAGGIVYHSNVYNAHPFSFQKLSQELGPHQKWAFRPLFQMSGLARAMGYLQEASISMCYNALRGLAAEDPSEDSQTKSSVAAANAKKLRTDPLYQDVIKELETQKARQFTMHPKLDRLKTFLVQHFAGHMPDEDGESSSPDKTRAMVFVTFRECVGEIVDALNFDRPMLRAAAFIGQATDKQGRKGLAQKDQLELIQKFKAGDINILVATSIGEEGLDIGEVDLIICYDAQKTPIRMLQRIGRTGRKRSGAVHVLLAEGREEQNFDKAKDAYSHVQKTIWSGADIELYGDVERLLPDHVKPQCLEKEMEIVEYTRTDEYRRIGRTKSTNKGGERTTKSAKRKRNDAPDRNIPYGAMTGFLQASKLTKKRKITYTDKELDAAGQDNSSDLDIESGYIIPPRRAQSDTNPSKRKAIVKRAATTTDGRKPKIVKTAKKNAKAKSPFPVSDDPLSLDNSDGASHVDDPTVPQVLPRKMTRREPSLPITSSRLRSLSPMRDTIELSSQDDLPNDTSTPMQPPSRLRDFSDGSQVSNVATVNARCSMAWLMDGSDEDSNVRIVGSSPSKPVSPIPLDDSIEISEVKPREGYQIAIPKTPCLGSPSRRSSPPWPEWSPRKPLSPIKSRTFIGSPSGCALPLKHPARKYIQPRASTEVPPSARATQSETPASSFPVRPVRRRVDLRRTLNEVDSPSGTMPPPAAPRRLRRRNSSLSPPERPDDHLEVRRRTGRQKYNVLLDVTAEHSGDEVSAGSSHSEVDIEDEYDQDFVRELPETQVSPSYDQSLAYRQSLMTQAPGNPSAMFKDGPVRRGVFGSHRVRGTWPQVTLSSSPRRADESPNEYQFGSFVVDDDAEISYDDEPSFD